MKSYFKRHLRLNYRGGLFKWLYPLLNFYLKLKTKNSSLLIGSDSLLVSCEVGKNVVIFDNVICRSSSIGDYSYVNRNTDVFNTKIGKFCSIGPGCNFGLGRHPSGYVSTHPVFYSKKNTCFHSFHVDESFAESSVIMIGNDVWIGAGVTILDGVNISDGAIIAAGAVVVRDVEPYSVCGGVPAKLLKYRFEADDIEILEEIKWWDFDEKFLVEISSKFNSISEITELYEKK